MSESDETEVEFIIGDMTAAWAKKSFRQAFRGDCKRLVEAVRKETRDSLEEQTKERQRIASHLKTVAIALIKDPKSDGIDGYAGAVLLDLAQTIEKNGVPTE